MGSARNSNRFMFCFIIYQITASIFLELSPLFSPGVSRSAQIVIPQAVIFILPCIFIALSHRDNLKQIFPFKNIGILNFVMIIVLSLLAFPFVMLIGGVTSLFFENNLGESIDAIVNEGSLLLSLSVLAVTPAICEELTFRGVVLSGCKNVNIIKAALISGLFFGIMHLNLNQFFYAVFMGAIFAVFVRLTGSLWSSILAHFTVNATQASLSYWINTLPEDINKAEQTTQTLIDSIIALGVFCAFLLPIFIGLFYVFVEHNKKRNLLSKAFDTLEDFEAETDETENIEPKKPERILTLSFWGTIIIFVMWEILILNS